MEWEWDYGMRKGLWNGYIVMEYDVMYEQVATLPALRSDTTLPVIPDHPLVDSYPRPPIQGATPPASRSDTSQFPDHPLVDSYPRPPIQGATPPASRSDTSQFPDHPFVDSYPRPHI